MRIEIPDIGVDEAIVAEILVKVGDVVSAEQSLLLLESDKAAVEVPSPAAGTIREILLNTGDTVQQGHAAFELETSSSASEASTNEKASATLAATADATDKDNAHNNSSQPPDQNTSSNASKDVSARAAQPATSEASSSPESHAATATTSGRIDVQVPDIGVEKAVVSEILVQVGDEITAEQSIVLLESDKASVEVPSPVAGTVVAILVKTGDSVKEGVLLLQLTTLNSAASSQPASVTVNVSEAKTAEATSTTPQSATEASQRGAATSSLTAAQQADNAQVHAGPAVRQLARQLGVPLREVKATGVHARIVKEDVFAYVKTRLIQPKAANGVAKAPALATGLPKLANFDAFGGGEWHTLTRLQQVSIPQLSLNNYIPQVTQFDLADITELEVWRESLKADYKAQGISLTILAFIAKAVAHLLKKEAFFAAHLSDDGQSVLLRNEIHMGIAVATPDGLTVPVLRHPDQKSIAQIAQELMLLSQKARDKKLNPKDLQGANFSITSLGSIGGTAFTPLVNWPQVAILGISPANMQPVWDGAHFVPRLMLPLSLSYDHRVINGADAARFSHQLTLLLKDIRQLLL